MEKCNMTGEESGLWLQCNAVFENVIWKMQNKEKYNLAGGERGIWLQCNVKQKSVSDTLMLCKREEKCYIQSMHLPTLFTWPETTSHIYKYKYYNKWNTNTSTNHAPVNCDHINHIY